MSNEKKIFFLNKNFNSILSLVLFALLILCLPSKKTSAENNLWTQAFEQGKVSLAYNAIQANELTLNLYLNEGWFAYSPHPENSDKIMKASFKSHGSKQENTLQIEWPKNLKATNHTFSKQVVFEQLNMKIILPNVASQKGQLHLQWVICKDVCIPINATFDIGFTNQTVQKTTLAFMILTAFLGGLILNIMPCVLPIISLKLLHIQTLSGQSFKQAIAQNLLYSAGILVSMLLLLLAIIVLKVTGTAIGWGFQLQNPYFIYLMLLLITAIGLQLSGKIKLPEWLYQLQSQSATWQQKHQSHFFQGCLAVLLASPCSAPFMGTAISFALSQPIYIAGLIISSLALGFAFPFLLLSLLPNLIKYLPKPGPWMQKMEKILAIPLYATSLWLAYLLYAHISEIAFMIILFISLLALLAFIFKSKHKLLTWLGFLLFVLCLALIKLQHTNPNSQAPLIKKIFEIKETKQQALFVNVTADWCVTCKANEKLVLKTSEINQLFKTYHVRVLTLDWTQHSPEITQYLNQYGLSSVPSYIFYPPGKPEIVLSAQLTKKSLKQTIQDQLEKTARKKP